MSNVWHVPADDGSGEVEIRPVTIVNDDQIAELSDLRAKIECIRTMVATWAVDDDTYLHLDGQDLGYADAAVQITAIIDNPI